jgi:uncharacterized membrane protein
MPAITFPRFLLVCLVTAVITHVLVTWAPPRVIMYQVMKKASESADANGVLMSKRPDETARAIVMPSPDLLYAVCPYDLARGPWRLSANVPDTYWSLSLFAANTDNFFVANGDVATGRVEVDLLAAPPAPGADPGRLQVVSPSTRGLAVFRFLVRNSEDDARIGAFQQSAACRPF